MPLINLHNVEFNYETLEGIVKALNDVSLSIESGEFVATGGITILIALITMAVNILVTLHARRNLMLDAN